MSNLLCCAQHSTGECRVTIEELEQGLRALGWKGSDFCRKTGVSRTTVSRWVNGHTPVPEWVPSYLAAMAAIKQLYESTVLPSMEDGAASNEEK